MRLRLGLRRGSATSACLLREPRPGDLTARLSIPRIRASKRVAPNRLDYRTDATLVRSLIHTKPIDTLSIHLNQFTGKYLAGSRRSRSLAWVLLIQGALALLSCAVREPSPQSR